MEDEDEEKVVRGNMNSMAFQYRPCVPIRSSVPTARGRGKEVWVPSKIYIGEPFLENAKEK